MPVGFRRARPDNQILGVVRACAKTARNAKWCWCPRTSTCASRPRALGLPAEDYFNDKVLEDGALLYSGILPLPADFWDRHGRTMESWQQGGQTFYRVSGPLLAGADGQPVRLSRTPGAVPLYARVTRITGKTAVLRTLDDYSHASNAVWGIIARNREQNFALNVLMDPECDFVTLSAPRAPARPCWRWRAGLRRCWTIGATREIIVTRVTVPVGEDIGFLPGTEEEKMAPWMGALDDNLEVLAARRWMARQVGPRRHRRPVAHARSRSER